LDVGFENATSRDYRLRSSSPYRAAATDGADIGANIEGVLRATAGVVP
jgi:hypothetical protein